MISGCPGLFPGVYQQLNKAANPTTTPDYTYCNDEKNSSSSRTGATLLFDLSSKSRINKYRGNFNHLNQYIFFLCSKVDPYETTNLATTNATLLATMQALLAAYVKSSVTPLISPTTSGSPKSNPSRWNGMWTSGWC